MKEKLANAFLILLGVGVLLYLLVSSVMDLTNKKDVHTVTLHEAYEVLELKHTINGLIPIGTDYYYLGIDDADNAYLIKASKKWLEKNFGSGYQSLNSDGTQIKGLVKEVSDYKTERELEYRLSLIEGVRYPFGTLGCMNLDYILAAVLKLVDFVLLTFVFAAGKYIFKKKGNVKPVFVKIWIIVMIISFILLIGIIR